MKQFVSVLLFMVYLQSYCSGEAMLSSDKKILLENQNARWTFNKQNFGLIAIDLKILNGTTVYSCMNGFSSEQIWKLSFRDAQGVEYEVDGSDATEIRKYELVTRGSTQVLYLHWLNTKIQDTNSFVNVSVQIVLQLNGLAESKISISPVREDLALFSYFFMIVSNLGSGRHGDDFIYVPNELGERKIRGGGGDRYPSGPVSMPFMLYHTERLKNNTKVCKRGFGLFYGVTDAKAYQKEIRSFPTLKGNGFYANLFPENNVMPLRKQIESVPFLIGPFCGDWWDGTQIYRNWALQNAPWTKAGPMYLRRDIPEWFKELTLWLNSHWTNGELENHLGDPLVFEKNVNRFLAVFKQSEYFDASTLAVHWYTWHQVAWETNFPNYFPAKDNFDEVTKRLQDQGVRLLPYINGRLYDINNQSWVQEEGETHCCKSSAARCNPLRTPMYIETYTTQQLWAVMCPATSFWQKKIASLSTEFAKKHYVDGVYIDQLASKPSVLCFDPKHNHPVGGGSYWTDGYINALIRIRSQIDNRFALVSDPSNDSPFFATESNAETYIPYFAGYLVIGGYRNCPMVPMFQAVYSDYTITFGKHFRGFLAQDPITVSKELSMMFAYGTQIGWFALEGDDGFLEFFEDEDHAFMVDFMTKLMRYRTLGLKYFNGGRLLRPLYGNYTNDFGCVPDIATSVWSSREKNSLGVFVVDGGLGDTQFFKWNMDLVEDYGLPAAKSYSFSQIMLDGEVVLLQTFNSSQIEFETMTEGLTVLFYEVRPTY